MCSSTNRAKKKGIRKSRLLVLSDMNEYRNAGEEGVAEKVTHITRRISVR